MENKNPILIPRNEVLKYNKNKLIEWIKKVLLLCNKKIYIDKLQPKLFNKLKKIIINKYHPKIELLFKQPFPLNYGLDSKGEPTIDFIKYMKSDHPYRTVTFVKDDLSKNNLFITDDCIILYYMCIYQNNRVFIIEDNGTCYSDNSKKFIIDNNKNQNVKFKKCINDKKNIYIKLIFKMGNYNHIFGISLNFEKQRYYLIDSGYKIGDEAYNIFYQNISKEISNYINKNFEIKIEIKPFIIKETQICPNFGSKIQGETHLCIIWTYYSIIIHLINPDMKYKNIYKELIKYDQLDRDRLILRYLYFLYNEHKEDIDNTKNKEGDDFILPIW